LAKLGVNIDHVATIREARGTIEPEPVLAATLAEIAGADGITVHLREDRRHIQDRDVRLIRQSLRTRLNLEMAATKEMRDIALEIQPDSVTLVPEKREELTTEGGLHVCSIKKELKIYVQTLKEGGITVSLFIDPDEEQIEAAFETGTDYIEIHTGKYAEAVKREDIEREFAQIQKSVEKASRLGLGINAGHGLDYWNIKKLLSIQEIEEYNIGHSIISRAVITGLDRAVREMAQIIKWGSEGRAI